jgi:hypothetical protein
MRNPGALLVLLAVALLVGADGLPRTGTVDRPRARFLLTVGSSGDLTGAGRSGAGPVPWFQVHEIDGSGLTHLVESVPQPSPPAGEARELLAGPGGVYLVVSSLPAPCGSSVHRFRLTDAGRVTDLAPLAGGAVPAIVAGVAMSRDARRIAYSTLPCAPPASFPGMPARAQPAVSLAQRPVLTVLDLTTGRRRDWSTASGTAIGSIVWAADGRRLGYTLGTMTGESVDGVTVHALDTEAPGAEAGGGRVLLARAAYTGHITSATMSLDGRGGYGTLRRSSPPATVMFRFTAGRPVEVVGVDEDEPGAFTLTAVNWGDSPRFACRGGVDAFARPSGNCSSATDVPD